MNNLESLEQQIAHLENDLAFLNMALKDKTQALSQVILEKEALKARVHDLEDEVACLQGDLDDING